MNKPIPIFEEIHEWSKVIRLTDKQDFEYECTNVGGFERALLDGHDWDNDYPNAKGLTALQFLKDKTIEDYRKEKEFDLVLDVNEFLSVHPEKFDEYFKQI